MECFFRIYFNQEVPIQWRNKMHWTRLPRYLCNLLRSLYYLKGIKFYGICIEEDVLKKKKKIHNFFYNWIAKANGLRKRLYPWFFKDMWYVCVFSKFPCMWDWNYNKIAWKQPFKKDTLTNHQKYSKSCNLVQ